MKNKNITKYSFCKRCGLPESSLRDIFNNPDHDIGEQNIIRISEGMNCQTFELFLKEGDYLVIINPQEIQLVLEYRELNEIDKEYLACFLNGIKDRKKSDKETETA